MISLPNGSIPAWILVATAVVGLIGAGIAVFIKLFDLMHSMKQAVQNEQEILISHESQLKVLFDQTNRLMVDLSSGTLSVERYRLAERNIAIAASARLLYQGDPADLSSLNQPYVLAQVDLTNTGVRPVDVLACLVSGRIISDANWPGLGREGREVGWETLTPAYWDAEEHLLAGLSTTGKMFNSRGEFLRLDPGECESVLRLDAVTDIGELHSIGQINLLYKIFVVVAGHPISFDDTGRRLTGIEEQLALLPRQHFIRWRCIQYSLYNLNRFSFRLALQAAGDKYYKDPLGRITTPAGWRCFLLHHWDFEQLLGQQPKDAPNPYGDQRRAQIEAGHPWPTVREVNNYIQSTLRAYDPRLRTTADLDAAREYCLHNLAPMVSAWRELNEAIDLCMNPDKDFGWLIQQEGYKERWDALLREGYVLSHWWGGSPASVDELAPERYVASVRYAPVTIHAPGLRRPDAYH